MNAVANFCFLTKDCNAYLSDRLPEDYFREVEERQPGALASHWIPMDRDLWRVERYPTFLEERRKLLAEAANDFLTQLYHGALPAGDAPPPGESVFVPGGIADREEEERLELLNEWVVQHGLPRGELLYALSDADDGSPVAILDMAWPDGLQEGLGQPVTVLLNENGDVRDTANAHGFRFFTSDAEFKRYVEQEVLAGVGAHATQ